MRGERRCHAKGPDRPTNHAKPNTSLRRFESTRHGSKAAFRLSCGAPHLVVHNAECDVVRGRGVANDNELALLRRGGDVVLVPYRALEEGVSRRDDGPATEPPAVPWAQDGPGVANASCRSSWLLLDVLLSACSALLRAWVSHVGLLHLEW